MSVWTRGTLGEAPNGAVLRPLMGNRELAVKSEYRRGDGRCLPVLLASGEYAAWPAGDEEPVEWCDGAQLVALSVAAEELYTQVRGVPGRTILWFDGAVPIALLERFFGVLRGTKRAGT